MTLFLRLGACLLLLANAAVAQSVVPVPRPSDEERVAAAAARADEAEIAAAQVALAEAEPPRPLTPEETASFMAQVRACWNVAGLPAEVQGIGVRVRFTMTEAGEPLPNTFEMMQASVSDPDRSDLAFLAARRAVIRCGEGGYDLPAAAFPYWERVEINFDPTDAGGN